MPAPSLLVVPRPPDSPIGFSPFASAPTPAVAMVQALSGSGGVVINNAGQTIIIPATGLLTSQAFIPSLGLSFVAFKITNAQMIAGTALTLLQGRAGSIIQPVGGFMIHLDSTLGAYGSAQTVSLRYLNGTADLTTPQNGPQAVAGQRWISAPSTAIGNHVANSPIGQGIRLVFSAGNAGGNAANTLTYAFQIQTTAAY